MRKKLTRNLGLKIVSALFAIVLWLVVVNTIDPVERKTFNNVKVSVTNESAIKSQGKVYDVVDNSDVISLSVKGRRAALEKLKSSDFTAVADMMEMTVANAVPIEVSVSRYNDSIVEIVPKTKTLKISIEDSATKQFPISVITTGSAGEGYTVGEASCNPSVLKISGAASVVNKISKVAVEVELGDMTTTINDNSKPRFYDSDGDIVESTSLEYKDEDVAVTVSFLKTKEIPLRFGTTGAPAEDYRFVETVCAPDKVTVAGSASALSKIEEIQIPDSLVNISGAKENVVQIIPLTEYLPDNIRLIDSNDENVLVTAIIEKVKIQNFEIPVEKIELLNVPDGYSTSMGADETVLVIIRGLAENVNKIKQDDIRISADLSNISGGGTKNVPLTITLPDGADVETGGDTSVSIVLSKKVVVGRQ